MSNSQWWETDDDDEFEETPPAAPNPRDLRNQLKAALKEKKELQSKLSSMETAVRRSSIKDFFRDEGINPKLAKYVPADVDPTPDNLKKWIEEDGDLFGIGAKPPTGNENKAPESPEGAPVLPGAEGGNVTPDVQAAWAQMNATTQNAVPGGQAEDLMAKITSGSEDDLRKLIFSHGGGGF